MTDCATPWTIAHQAPLSTDLSRQENWNGLPVPLRSKEAWDGNRGLFCSQDFCSFPPLAFLFRVMWKYRYESEGLLVCFLILTQIKKHGTTLWEHRMHFASKITSLEVHNHSNPMLYIHVKGLKAFLTQGRQEEKGTAEGEIVGWHHWLHGHEFEQAPGVGDGRGGLACCGPGGHNELDTTERLNWTEQNLGN